MVININVERLICLKIAYLCKDNNIWKGMQLFYAPDFVAPECTLPEEESAHAVRVLRLAEGDRLHVTDGRGTVYLCEIVSASPKRCAVRVLSSGPGEFDIRYRLTLAVAPPKNMDRYEWFLEKATEIGVTEIVPLLCERSERRVIKPERECKVIVAAVKQSLKSVCPVLRDMTPFERFVSEPFVGRRFIAHCDEPIRAKRYIASLLHPGEDAVIMVGPEGDFSPEEIRLAVECGFEETTLGSQRLRTETAAVFGAAAVSVINNM